MNNDMIIDMLRDYQNMEPDYRHYHTLEIDKAIDSLQEPETVCKWTKDDNLPWHSGCGNCSKKIQRSE